MKFASIKNKIQSHLKLLMAVIGSIWSNNWSSTSYIIIIIIKYNKILVIYTLGSSEKNPSYFSMTADMSIPSGLMNTLV